MKKVPWEELEMMLPPDVLEAVSGLTKAVSAHLAATHDPTGPAADDRKPLAGEFKQAFVDRTLVLDDHGVAQAAAEAHDNATRAVLLRGIRTHLSKTLGDHVETADDRRDELLKRSKTRSYEASIPVALCTTDGVHCTAHDLATGEQIGPRRRLTPDEQPLADAVRQLSIRGA